MKVLIVADEELRELWDYWDTAGKKRLEGVRLILSAGDIRPEYLEFLVTMLNVPCLYVRGNHDGRYDKRPPEGCVDIDGLICEVEVSCGHDAARGRTSADQEDVADRLQKSEGTDESSAAANERRVIRIAGLGGSMRYRKGSDMYSERQMSSRVRKLSLKSRLGLAAGPDGKTLFSRELAADDGGVDIFLTHAPCKGHGDMEDLAHTGFECFNRFLEDMKPSYHCYGHVHLNYGLFKRVTEHPSGTTLINCSGMYVLEI